MKAPTTTLSFALATLFAAAVAYAQQQPQVIQQPRPGQAPGQTTAQEKEIPEMLKALNLTDQQKQQIKQICGQHEQELTQLEQQFQKLHNKCVMLEAAWTTALESQMDDTQKQKFRQSREKAKQEMMRQGGRSEVYFRGEPGEESGTRQGTQGTQPAAREQGDQARSDQPQQRDQQRDQAQRDQTQRDQAQRSAQPGAQGGRFQQGTQPTAQESERILIITVASPQQHYTAAGLSDDQQRKCDQMCEAFHEEIGNTWRQLRNVHQEMVAIEVEKMSAVEKILTDEQRQQLKRAHEQFQTSTQQREGSDQIRLQPQGQNRTFRNNNSNNNNVN